MTARQAYVVVCTDLHIAAGLFMGAEEAIENAKYMNKMSKGSCTFKPVPIELRENVEFIDVTIPDTPEGLTDRGYL